MLLILANCFILGTYLVASFTKNLGKCGDNPLKGLLTSPDWTTYSRQKFPSSLDFYYLSLRDTFKGYNSFDWSILEKKLVQSANNKRHAIVRFYMDYPKRSTAIPQFLLDGGLKTNGYSEHGGGRSPDYTNANLQKALVNFVTAFGKKYDGDKRIAVIQTGILGFWGEQHTYPKKWCCYSNQAIYKAFVDAFRSSFKTTQLELREPKGYAGKTVFGYHDDSLCYASIGSVDWYYWNKVIRAGEQNQWKNYMNGGEIYPQSQSSVFTSGFQSNPQNFMATMRTTHSTYALMGHAYSTGFSGGDYTRALNGHRALGYNIYIKNINVYTSGTNTKFAVTLQNDGFAPFYYDLVLRMKILSRTLSLGGISKTGLLPGASKTLTFTLATNQITCRTCSIQYSLYSSYAARVKKTIKLCNQGAASNGVLTYTYKPGTGGNNPSPTNKVTNRPTKRPINSPTGRPTNRPSGRPTARPGSGSKAYKSLGCYNDRWNRAFGVEKGYGFNNVDKCYKACMRYKYFAIQDGAQCFCENDSKRIVKYGRASGSCPALGGSWINHIYMVNANVAAKVNDVNEMNYNDNDNNNNNDVLFDLKIEYKDIIMSLPIIILGWCCFVGLFICYKMFINKNNTNKHKYANVNVSSTDNDSSI